MKLTKFRLDRGPQGANESNPKKRKQRTKISTSNCVKINIETRFLVLEYKFEIVDRELLRGIGSSPENKMYKLAVDLSHRDENGCRVRRI